MSMEHLRTARYVLGDGMRMRTGRSVGRTIYLTRTEEPSRADFLVGIMDTPALAQIVVDAVNALAEQEQR